MSIPNFPDSREIVLEDKQEFDSYLQHDRTNLSEYTFTNFFTWRKADRTKLSLINGDLCCLVTAPDKKQYFMMPIGGGKMEDTLLKCLEVSPKVVRVSHEFIDKFIAGNDKFAFEEDRDQEDYVYLSKDLIELKGRKYDAKRNHLNFFLKTNEFVYEKLSKKHVLECIELNDIWCKEKKRESELFPNVECEGEVVKEALNNYNELALTGGAILIKGKIKAFSIGEKLAADTAAIHIEKADPGIRGLSQLINREFVKNEWSNFTFINREQDMGHPGLRKAKMSYHPVRMEKKYNIMLKS
jgi:hypothetical protein